MNNACDTDKKKDAFRADGWTPYYGKRLWDGRAAAMVVGSFFPATSAVAINEFYSEIKTQTGSAMDMLEEAAGGAVRTRARRRGVGSKHRGRRLAAAWPRRANVSHPLTIAMPLSTRTQVDDLIEKFGKLIQAIINDPFSTPKIDGPTFGLKAAVLHISCNNEAAGIKLPSEGYSQFAFAYKVKG